MAQVAARAIHNPDRVIAATQLGITLASLGLGWIGEPALAHFIDPVVALIPVPAGWGDVTSHSIAAALSFALITFTHVVVGELAPKSIALQRPEATAMFVAQPTIIAETIFRPGIWLLNGAGNALLKLLGFEAAGEHEAAHSVEEIKMLLDASATHGLLEDGEIDMLDAIFDMRLLLVRQVMIPRTEMTSFQVDATLRDLLALQDESPYTKFPVYEKNPDHIVGVLHVRDVLQPLSRGEIDTPIRSLMREAIFLPETARINAALAAFRDSRQHMAIVLDEYGGTAGLITLEDVLEEISGDIPDQFESDLPEILQRPDGTWDVSGLALIEDVNEDLQITLSDENYDTIGGYVMGKLERIPQAGDEIQVDGVRFTVQAVDGMRIDRLNISISREAAPPPV
jgi:CBS domain containing-hemolysin-like protein